LGHIVESKQERRVKREGSILEERELRDVDTYAFFEQLQWTARDNRWWAYWMLLLLLLQRVVAVGLVASDRYLALLLC
jgi:hypothetical protein